MIRSIILGVVSFLLAVACSDGRLNKGTIIAPIAHDAAQCPDPANFPANDKILSMTKMPTGSLSIITAEHPGVEFVVDGHQKSRSPDGKSTYIFRGGCSNQGFAINYILDGKPGSIKVEKTKTGYTYSSQYADGKPDSAELK